jgi:diadenylate cyclase
MIFDLTITQPVLLIAVNCLDFILVYLLAYRVLFWLDRSRAFDLIKGLVLIFLIFLLSNILQLETLNWILEKFATVFLILVVIIFQPKLRRFLEQIGSTGNFLFVSQSKQVDMSSGKIQQLLKAVESLSREKIGALIVIERETTLDRYIETGIAVNADLQAELISSLFWPGSPTHDGAVIIRKNRILGAACFLPLTENKLNDRRLGTRHHAALGLSEVSDALIIVISAETGVISIAEEGCISRHITKEVLETHLFSLFTKDSHSTK